MCGESICEKNTVKRTRGCVLKGGEIYLLPFWALNYKKILIMGGRNFLCVKL